MQHGFLNPQFLMSVAPLQLMVNSRPTYRFKQPDVLRASSTKGWLATCNGLVTALTLERLVLNGHLNGHRESNSARPGRA